MLLIDETIDKFGSSSATMCMSRDFFITANIDDLTLNFHTPHKNRWKLLGDVFIGEFITSVQPFCIPLDLQSTKPQPWIFSTETGSIYRVIPLLRHELDLLVGLCRCLNRLLKDELFQMREWIKYRQSTRFIDGEYVCCMLSLDDSNRQAIAEELGVPLDAVSSLIRYITSCRLI